MSVLLGMFYLECNTFNPYMTGKDQFTFFAGKESLEFLHVTDLFEAAGIRVVPSIMASALPAGPLKEADYWYFANQILDAARKEGNQLQGIWLHLHGALEVENIGSGELELLKSLREIVGERIPIAITVDAHANHNGDISRHADIIRGYHTIPHHDQPDVERKTASALIDLIKSGCRTKTALITLPMVLVGEKALTNLEPLKSLMEISEQYEKMPEIAAASVYIGDSWCDSPNTHLSVSVTPKRLENYPLAVRLCAALAQKVFDARWEFDFEIPVMTPEEAINAAFDSDAAPVFVSDTGDNTTGGAVGDSTEMLWYFSQYRRPGKRVLITTIYDPSAYARCCKKRVGETVNLMVGRGESETSRPFLVNGTVHSFGWVLGYLNCQAEPSGQCVTIRTDFADIMISNVPGSFISPAHFQAGKTPISEYDIIVIKQGYLFSELRPIAKRFLMAITKGTSYHFIEELEYKRINRPAFPFDPATEFDAETIMKTLL